MRASEQAQGRLESYPPEEAGGTSVESILKCSQGLRKEPRWPLGVDTYMA